MNEKNNITKTAMLTVCGRPNVGKSSLTNALVGEKIAIVSNKPQTTRNRIYGVVNRGDTQFILLDTPGLHKARSRLGDYMVKVVRESLASVEAALLLVEPIPHVGEPEKILLQRIREEKLPCVLCINKIDTVERKDDLLAVIAAYSEVYPDFDAIIPISARTGDGLEDLLTQMQRYAVEGPQLFPDGMTTDQPDQQVCAEIIREKMLLCLDKEPQGHHHRQARGYAQAHQHAGPAGYREVHGYQGLSGNVGEGQGKLAGQCEFHSFTGLQRTVIPVRNMSRP